jgi:hypothetical protein
MRHQHRPTRTIRVELHLLDDRPFDPSNPRNRLAFRTSFSDLQFLTLDKPGT